jgi:anaerobic magnesium-protoporphyrin IX monomethyl ester cyclase
MKITLVHPAGSNWVPGRRDITAVANRMAPLGILSIAAYLRREGHEMTVHDCLGPGAPSSIERNVEAVASSAPDLAGFSVTTSGFLDAYEMACRLKEINPGLITVFGGVHASALGASLLERFPRIDYLCMGEGERVLADIASGKDPASVPGLVWRNAGTVKANGSGEPIADLDSLPFPAYDLLAGFPRGYNLPLFSHVGSPGATMITSRGCPYQCSYCDRSVFRRSYRYNSAPYIYEHMNFLRTTYGVRHVNIYDDLFTLHRDRIESLCGMLIERPMGLQFNCAVRVGFADDGLLALLKRAGCLMVSLGIESADPEMLRRHKSGVSLEDVRDTVARIQRHGLRAKGLFMMGLPGETEQSIRLTAEFVLSLGLDDMNMSKFTPFPGAPIWKNIRDEGDFNEDWRLMNCLNFVFLPSGIESRERLDHLYGEFVKGFYMSKNYRRKFTRRLWQHRYSLLYFLRHIPSFLEAKRTFETD